MNKVLMKGNEAMALAAIKAGCDAFFGYPITPQNELPEYLSLHMQKHGKVFVQAESEVAAINMVYGAAGTGANVLTSSSSPGIALKQEGISYCAGSELPAVIINVMRGGPGLGSIQPSQADYNQITRGGGNGDYHVLSYAPESIQEAVDLIAQSFAVAQRYRNPVMIAVDGLIGQMMEPVFLDHIHPTPIDQPIWAANGESQKRGHKNKVVSLFLDTTDLEKHNLKLKAKYDAMVAHEQRYECVHCEDANIVIVAFGSVARLARSVIQTLRIEGLKVGLLRPITLWPFPQEAFDGLSENVTDLITMEMSLGQMHQDVLIVNQGQRKTHWFGRSGGVVPGVTEMASAVREALHKGGVV